MNLLKSAERASLALECIDNTYLLLEMDQKRFSMQRIVKQEEYDSYRIKYSKIGAKSS